MYISMTGVCSSGLWNKELCISCCRQKAFVEESAISAGDLSLRCVLFVGCLVEYLKVHRNLHSVF
jgi:hypothetical protein